MKEYKIDIIKNFNLFFKDALNSVLLLDVNGKILEINDSALKIYRWDYQQVVYQNFFRLCMDGHIYFPLNNFTDISSGKRISGLVNSIRTMHDQEIFMLWNISLVEKEEVEPIILMVGSEISVKKTLEENDVRSDVYLYDIINQVPHTIFWKDKNSVFLGCNETFAKLAGLSCPEEIIGKTDYDLPWAAEESDAYREDDRQVMFHGKAKLNIEEEQTLEDGSKIVLLTSKVPLYDKDGNISGVLGVYRDITERKKLEKELKIAKEEAEKSNRAKTVFIANVSHDIRTPLVGIQGIANSLTKKIPKKFLVDVKSMANASSELLSLLNEVINFAKIELGEMQENEVPFSLKALLNQVVNLFVPVAKEKNLHLICKYDVKVPNWFFGCRMFIHRILLNLVSNALKFTHNGQVLIHVKLDKADAKKDKLPIQIQVTDTGIGIPKEFKEEIFKSFRRLHPAYEGVYKGSGLGLSISKQLVEQIGGSIEVASEVNKGSTFTLRIPLLKSQEESKKSHTDEELDYVDDIMHSLTDSLTSRKDSDQIQIIQPFSKEQSRYHLLLVEDNRMIQKITIEIFNELNCYVDVAGTGQQALTLIENNQYDLIFMDIGLPDMSGLTVANKIRNLTKNNNSIAPIIALTAHMDESSKETCEDAGIDDVLIKPITSEIAEKILNRFLAKNENQQKISPDKDVEIFENDSSLVIDLAAGAKKIGKKSEHAKSMLDLLVKTLGQDQLEIQFAYQNNQLEKLEYLVHRLHGASCYCSTPRLTKAAGKLEEALHQKNSKNIKLFYQSLCSEIDMVLQAYTTLNT